MRISDRWCARTYSRANDLGAGHSDPCGNILHMIIGIALCIVIHTFRVSNSPIVTCLSGQCFVPH